MPITPRSIRWTHRAVLALPFALAGCQRDESPAQTTGYTPEAARRLTVASSTSTPIVPSNVPAQLPTLPANSRYGGTSEPVPGPAIAAPELTASRDRATLDAAASQVQHNVEQTSNAVANQASALQSGVTEVMGDVQTQAKQAANDAAEGVKGFAAELRDDAQQTVSDTFGEVKGGISDSLNDAKSSVQGQVQSTVDGAKGKVRSAVEDAKQAARRKAKAATDDVRKTARGYTDSAIDGLFGKSPK